MTDHIHRLDADHDAGFLAEKRTDPFTSTPFEAGNSVVRAHDGTILLRESWEAVGKRFRGETRTLPWSNSGPTKPAPNRPAETQHTPAPVARTLQEPRPEARREKKTSFLSLPQEGKRTWLWVPLGIAGLVVVAVLVAGLFRDNEDLRDLAPVSQISDVDDSAEAFAMQAGTVEGTLSDNDFRTPEGSYQDAYLFEADSSGGVVFIRLETRDFTPDVFVDTEAGRRVAGRRVSSDDGAEIIEVRDLQGPGTFRITVTSRRPREEGAYSLTARQERPVRTLRADSRPVTVTLGAFSERVNNAYRDVWEIQTRENFEHALTVSSSAFTPRVVILDSDGSAISPETSDVSGGSTYTFTSASAGTYRVLVTSGSDARRGRYAIRLEAREAEEDPPDVTLEANSGEAQRTLLQGQTHTHTFNGTVGDRVRVVVQSGAFSPTLSLSGPGDYRLSGDAPTAEQASLQFTVPASGVYSLTVTSRNAGQGGAYTLSLEASEAPSGQDVPRMPGFDAPPQEPSPDEPEPNVEGEAPAEPQPDPGEETEEYQPQQIGGD